MNSDEDNHESNDSTSQPANDVKVEKSSQNNEKAKRLRAKPDIPVMFSDSEDSLDGFGYVSKKRKNDSESEDDWAPQKGKGGSPKKKVKSEKSPKKPRKAREPKTKGKKEPKPKKEKAPPQPRKPRGRKAKADVKEENSNDISDEQPEQVEKEKKETEEDAEGEEEFDGEEKEAENDSAEESNPATTAECSVSSS